MLLTPRRRVSTILLRPKYLRFHSTQGQVYAQVSHPTRTVTFDVISTMLQADTLTSDRDVHTKLDATLGDSLSDLPVQLNGNCTMLLSTEPVLFTFYAGPRLCLL